MWLLVIYTYVIGVCHQCYEKINSIQLTCELLNIRTRSEITNVYSRDLNKNSIKGDRVEVGEVCAMVRVRTFTSAEK